MYTSLTYLHPTTILEATQGWWYTDLMEKEKQKIANEIEKASTLLEFNTAHESRPINKIPIAILGAIGVALVAYFATSGNYLGALLFWLAGVVIGFTIYEKNRNPGTTECRIKTEGVEINKKLYPYEEIKSFWIFYDPPHHQELSLAVSKGLNGGYVQVPFDEQDPLVIRETLIEFIPEKKQEEGLTETLARVIGL
jgi:hypothetical protein